MNRVRIIIPVLNDWVSFRMLLTELDRVAATLDSTLFVSAINDGSTEPFEDALTDLTTLQHLQGVELVHLSVNVGHQRAIAIGLCVAVQDDDFDALIIMDADGEDPPDAIQLLSIGQAGRSDFCVVARRRRRQETLLFKTSYQIYKLFFKVITGRVINFGNFSMLSRDYARRLVMVSDLWNNLPAAILRSRLPITHVTVDRGRRYAGKSKMNFTSLVVHGLSGISVYADTIFVRLLLLFLLLIALSAVSVAFLLFLRVFVPAHATPGWATTVTFGLTIIILQVLFTALSSILMLLNNRVQRLMLPIVDFLPYVAGRQLLFGRAFTEDAATLTSTR